MRIEINNGVFATAPYINDFDNLGKKIGDTIDELRKIESKLVDLPVEDCGGDLSGALANVRGRINDEERKQAAVWNVARKAEDFQNNTNVTDAAVARRIDQNKAVFFDRYPDLASVEVETENWWDKIVEKLKNFGEKIKDIFNGICDWISEHINEVKLVLGVVCIVVASLFTPAPALAFILLLVHNLGRAIGSGLVDATFESTINGKDFWTEFYNGFCDTFFIESLTDMFFIPFSPADGASEAVKIAFKDKRNNFANIMSWVSSISQKTLVEDKDPITALGEESLKTLWKADVKNLITDNITDPLSRPVVDWFVSLAF